MAEKTGKKPGKIKAFFSGRCDALITDASALYSVRATLSGNPDDYVIFPADNKVAPLTPAVRHGDDQWTRQSHGAGLRAAHGRGDRRRCGRGGEPVR